MSSIAVIVCSCPILDFKNYSDFRINLSGIIYTVPPNSYLTRYGKYCSLNVMYVNGLQNWVLGLNFFHNYYTVFD